MVLGSAGIFGGNEKTPVVSTATKPLQTDKKTVSPFSPLMHDLINKAGAPSQNRAVKAKPMSQSDGNTAINLVTGLPPVTTPITANTDTTDQQPSAIDLLKAALVQNGMDISGMQFNEHKDIVTYPGGAYVNDLISFQDGIRTHEYMANLVAINPQVTVNEIQQLLAGNRG